MKGKIKISRIVQSESLPGSAYQPGFF